MYRKTMLSPLSLYHYDNTVFDFMILPTSFFRWSESKNGMQEFDVPIDRQTVVDNILLQTAELSLAIDSSPEMFKQHVRIWSDKNFSVWQELWNTLNQSYNPIWNYDRTEHGKDQITERHTEEPDLVTIDDYERDLTDEGDLNNKVAAYNEGLADSDSSHSVNAATGTTKNTNTRKGKVDNNADDVHQHDFHAFGNIGVTTTAQMLEEQRKLVQFNITDYITKDFEKEFCIMIY